MTVRKTAKPSSPGYKAGASASLNLSARELDDFLDGLHAMPTNSELRKKYRALLTEFAQHWFHTGFNRGCIEAQRAWNRTAKFPPKISYDARRDFFRDGARRRVNITWPEA
jgi:hypothetical protein